jgi:hypothetical protein
MGRSFSGAGKKLLVLAVCIALFAAGLWWQRLRLLSWYDVYKLAQADDNQRARWAELVAGLDAAPVPKLLDLLRRDDAKVCANGAAALAALLHRWGPADARTETLAENLADSFGSLSKPGREAVLEWYVALLFDAERNTVPARPVQEIVAKLLPLAAKMQERGVRIRTTSLAEIVLERGAGLAVDLSRKLALEGMASKDAETCAAAVRLVMHAPLHTEKGLVDRVVPLLKDSSPQVRRAAVLAIGLAEETIAVEDLLPLLQDSDAEVRRLCEGALRGRGLQDTHIKLAKLITDQRSGQRLQVVQHLHEAEDLDAGIWLLRLSQDPSPAVRAAAIRFAAEDPAAADFQERMLHMAREDPSPSVRQLAAFYGKTYQRPR